MCSLFNVHSKATSIDYFTDVAQRRKINMRFVDIYCTFYQVILLIMTFVLVCSYCLEEINSRNALKKREGE